MMLVLLGFLDSLSGPFDDRISDGFLHEVDLTLSDQLHVRIGQRNEQFLLGLLAKSSLSLLICRSAATCGRCVTTAWRN